MEVSNVTCSQDLPDSELSKETGVVACSTDKFCAICCIHPVKYTCPQCKLRTCSLECCKQHKAEDTCTGIRDRLIMIPMSQYSALDLISDYRFLEEVMAAKQRNKILFRSAQDAIRAKQQQHSSITGRGSVSRYNTARNADASTDRGDFQKQFRTLRAVADQCKRRHIKLEFLPNALEKHASNTSSYNAIADTIFWKVSWLFPSAENACIDRERLPESVTVATLLKQVLSPKVHQAPIEPEMQSRLKKFQEATVHNCYCLMKVEQNGWTNDSRWYLLDKTKSLKENLANKILVEYPTIIVCLQHELKQYSILTDEMKLAHLRKKLWDKHLDVATLSMRSLLYELSAVRESKPQYNKAVPGPAGISSTTAENRPRVKTYREIQREKAMAVKEAKQLQKLAKQSRRTAIESMRGMRKGEWHAAQQDGFGRQAYGHSRKTNYRCSTPEKLRSGSSASNVFVRCADASVLSNDGSPLCTGDSGQALSVSNSLCDAKLTSAERKLVDYFNMYGGNESD